MWPAAFRWNQIYRRRQSSAFSRASNTDLSVIEEVAQCLETPSDSSNRVEDASDNMAVDEGLDGVDETGATGAETRRDEYV